MTQFQLKSDSKPKVIKMNKEKLIKTIQNLLDLAADKSSVHEAETAAKKAQELIMKYNIEEAALHGGKQAAIKDEEYLIYKHQIHEEGKWLRDLFHAVAKHNFCQIVIGKTRVKGVAKRFPDKYYWMDKFYILGEADNVELVKFLSEQLMHKLREAFKQDWELYTGDESKGIYMRSFFKGAASGVYWKLAEQQEQFSKDESTNALILRKDAAVTEYKHTKWPKLGKSRNTSATSNEGWSNGYSAGKSANINAGLRGKGGSRLLG